MAKDIEKRLKNLKKVYDGAAKKESKATAQDFCLRELEIDTASQFMKGKTKTLDVGCGIGYVPIEYATRNPQIKSHGIDYSEAMTKRALSAKGRQIESARRRLEFKTASVMELPYPDDYFDVVTASRCLMALLDWNRQKKAILEVRRVLKPGGIFVMMEGTIQGWEKLNNTRRLFGLEKIPIDTSKGLDTLKFDEKKLIPFLKKYWRILEIRHFGMYYFISRVIHPLLVAPNKPKFSAKINKIALEIAKKIPDWHGIGHLTAFILEKKK